MVGIWKEYPKIEHSQKKLTIYLVRLLQITAVHTASLVEDEIKAWIKQEIKSAPSEYRDQTIGIIYIYIYSTHKFPALSKTFIIVVIEINA